MTSLYVKKGMTPNGVTSHTRLTESVTYLVCDPISCFFYLVTWLPLLTPGFQWPDVLADISLLHNIPNFDSDHDHLQADGARFFGNPITQEQKKQFRGVFFQTPVPQEKERFCRTNWHPWSSKFSASYVSPWTEKGLSCEGLSLTVFSIVQAARWGFQRPLPWRYGGSLPRKVCSIKCVVQVLWVSSTSFCWASVYSSLYMLGILVYRHVMKYYINMKELFPSGALSIK